MMHRLYYIKMEEEEEQQFIFENINSVEKRVSCSFCGKNIKHQV